MAHIACVASLFFILTQRSTGQRKVTVPKGPLVRVEGYPLSLGCNVTGYSGSSQQDFQWCVHPARDLTLEFGLLSTADSSFTHVTYLERVRRGDFSLQRLRGDAVELRFSKLQAADSGEYECSTPTTDGTYYATNKDKVVITVIPDTLSATMPSQTVSKKEGEPLELTCEVSKATTQHTHLSVTYYHVKRFADKKNATEIISFSQDFEMLPGSVFRERFETGDVQLYKLGKTSFRLSIRRLLFLDQGRLYCEAKEWIQDPDGTWTPITKKETGDTILTIQIAGAPSPSARDLQATIKIEGTPEEGKTLELLCEVVGGNGDPQLQVTWLFNEAEITRLDPVGVVEFKGNYRQQANQGLLQAMKLSPMKFSLKILSAGPENQGTYRCEAAAMAKSLSGSWQVLQKAQSQNNDVQVKEAEGKHFQVTIDTEGTPEEGKTLELICEIVGNSSDPQLQVSWLLNGAEIIRIDPGGVVDFKGDYSQRASTGLLQVMKLSPKKFSLKIFSAAPENQGAYRCEVAAMVKSQGGSWKMIQTKKSRDYQVQLARQEGRDFQVTIDTEGTPKEGKTLELICEVVGGFSDPQLQAYWFINGAEITRLDPVGIVDFKEDYRQSANQGLLQAMKLSPKKFSLKIFSAGPENQGSYRCEVATMTKSQGGSWQVSQKRQSPENYVHLLMPEEWDFQVAITTTGKPQEGKTLQQFCEMVSISRFPQVQATWFFNGTEITFFDAGGIVDFRGDYRKAANQGLLQMLKLGPKKFSLVIFSAGSENEGTYRCDLAIMEKSHEGSWKMIQTKKSRDNRVKLIRQEGSEVRVSEVHSTNNATEHTEAVVSCSLESASASHPSSLFSVTWFWNEQQLLQLQHDGLVTYRELGHQRQRRMRCHRPSSTEFLLMLYPVQMEDAGTYHCRVTEWQLQMSPSKWVSQGTGQSQPTLLKIRPEESTIPLLICSSAFLPYLLVILPLVLFVLLLISLLSLARKARKLSMLSQHARMNESLRMSTSSQNAQMNDPLHQSTSSQNAQMNDPLQQSSNQNAHGNDPLQLHKKESKSSTGTIKRNKTTKHSRHLSL